MAPGEEQADWFDAGTSIGGLSASRDGPFLAMAGGSLDLQVTFWALDGPPPAPPTLMECGVTLDGSTFVNAVAYAPSSDAVAFQQGGDAGAGVAVLTGVDPVGCAATDGPFFPGAEQPFWGAAEFGVTTGGGGTPPPGGGRSCLGVTRLDGGGAADPVAQAVALSQDLFDDGDATRVVLATADRFPDALAGSALAGPFGPILFTVGQPATWTRASPPRSPASPAATLPCWCWAAPRRCPTRPPPAPAPPAATPPAPHRSRVAAASPGPGARRPPR